MHRSDTSGKKVEATPPVKVVGFHVEGASPSPRNTLLGSESLVHASSLSPVIIPPAFQGQRGTGDISPHQVMAAAAAAFGTGPEAAPAGAAQGVAPTSSSPLRPVRTASDTDALGAPGTPSRRSAALPLTPVASAPASAASTVPSASPFQMAAGGPPPAPAPTRPPAGAGQASLAERRPSAHEAPAPPAGKPTEAPQLARRSGDGHPPTPRAKQPGAAAPPKDPNRQDDEAAAAARGAPRQKEMTKAERRALQEAQRAAKAASKPGGGGNNVGTPPPANAARLSKQNSRESLAGAGVERSGSQTREHRAAGAPREAGGVAGGAAGGAARGGVGGAGGAGPSAPASAGGQQQQQAGTGPGSAAQHAPLPRSTELFAQLPRHHEVDVAGVVARGTAAALPLPAIQLGLTLAQGSLRGANARCIAMLDVFRQVVLEFRSAGGREFARELNPLLNSVISFLVFCRPLSVSMGAAIKHVKAAVEKLKLEPSVPESEAKERLLGVISSFVQEKILFAGDHLAGEAAKRIQSDDVVLTYGYSSVVAAVLLRAAAAGTPFAVVVADARPLLEGRRMLRALLAARVPAQYVALNGLSFVLPRVTKVLLGAGAVLSNGAVLARAGSAAVAMAASAAHVPVLVAAETYKFHERVQLDSITHNELGDPDLLVEMPGGEKAWLEGWREQEGLGLLSLMYDTMPAQFVSMVITEVGAIPPTSVPVILREQRADGNMA